MAGLSDQTMAAVAQACEDRDAVDALGQEPGADTAGIALSPEDAEALKQGAEQAKQRAQESAEAAVKAVAKELRCEDALPDFALQRLKNLRAQGHRFVGGFPDEVKGGRAVPNG